MSVREELHFHFEVYQRNVTVGMRSPKTFPVDVVSKSFSGGDECCAEKLENSAVRYLVGCPLIGHRGRRSRRVCGWLVERGETGRSTCAKLFGDRLRWVH